MGAALTKSRMGSFEVGGLAGVSRGRGVGWGGWVGGGGVEISRRNSEIKKRYANKTIAVVDTKVTSR